MNAYTILPPPTQRNAQKTNKKHPPRLTSFQISPPNQQTNEPTNVRTGRTMRGGVLRPRHLHERSPESPGGPAPFQSSVRGDAFRRGRLQVKYEDAITCCMYCS